MISRETANITAPKRLLQKAHQRQGKRGSPSCKVGFAFQSTNASPFLTSNHLKTRNKRFFTQKDILP